ncbi:phospholipase D family protein [Kordia algicida OT-1]|uniref:Phospholipase D-like domain-containing protein n=1 Tax=Kordia algicida OT-1 TaxID=391587 RepID=A9DV99_9FLAO|nr:phospholipase D family protein [Kordia algicida]EDP96393.1 hypothetical protein KAOT1_03252 [Kordia algicida OT-1]
MKVIGTTKISYEIEQILDKSDDYLVLVSPYFKLTQRLKVRLSDAFKSVDNVFLLYRENEIKYQELNWLKSFSNVKIFAIKNLHAKIYLNQEYALISSMNLYEYSQINNHEVAVMIERWEDSEAFEDTLNEIRIILASQYDETCFDVVLESMQDYSMGALFYELNDKYTFGNYRKRSQALYEFICDRARELTNFKEFELYQDKTAILRATNLGKARYTFLEEKLKKYAN